MTITIKNVLISGPLTEESLQRAILQLNEPCTKILIDPTQEFEVAQLFKNKLLNGLLAKFYNGFGIIRIDTWPRGRWALIGIDKIVVNE